MSRPLLLLFAALAAALAGLGVLADRAVRRSDADAAALAETRGARESGTAALSLRGALGQIEQEIGGAGVAGIAAERLLLPPLPAVSTGPPYRGRAASELRALAQSLAAAPSGLPEAVVAAVALDDPAVQRDVASRLLDGQIPVRLADLEPLAAALGAGNDPRVAALGARLRELPPAHDLPEWPAFRRTLADGVVHGWTRRDRSALHYRVPVSALVARAGVDRAHIGEGAPVPDVPGLTVAVVPEAPSATQRRLKRGLLWGAIALCLGILALVQRALAREARAVAREKAFVASITHELRTPVTAIRVFGETLAEGRGDARAYGALLAEESERLEALVERVLAATRLDEAPRFAPVGLADLVESAAQLMRPRAERRGVTLALRLEPGLGEATWDADGVRRAFLNLIDNAIKHGRAQGHVEASAAGDDRLVYLSVRDDGPGIARREQDSVFGRFSRGTTDAPGTGLGLYLVDQAARAHGGRVELQSGEGKGCLFTLVLPRRPPGAEAAP